MNRVAAYQTSYRARRKAFRLAREAEIAAQERKNFVLNVEQLAQAPRITAHSEGPANVGDNLEKVPLAHEPPGRLPPLKTETTRSP